jgi:hypothetical protein
MCPVPVRKFEKEPFCDGTHTKIHFNGTETADDTPYLEKTEKITGPALSLIDGDNMCVHARFCMGLVGSGTSRGNRVTLKPGTLL